MSEAKYPITRISQRAIDRADELAASYGSRAAVLDASVDLLAHPCDEAAKRTLALGEPFLGRGAAITSALEAWARTIEDAQTALDNVIGGPEEWCLIADACQSCELVETGWSNPGTLLAAEVEDAHRLNGTGYRWLGEGAKTDRRVTALSRVLADLSYLEAWAVIYALRYFWQAGEVPADAPWWLPSWRATRKERSCAT